MGKKKPKPHGEDDDSDDVRYVLVQPQESPRRSSALTRLLPDSTSENFLVGACAGGALAFAIGDRSTRTAVMRAVLRGYDWLVGSLAEVKEEAADIRADLRAEPRETS